ELRVHGPGDRLQIRYALLLQEQGQEVDLEQKIAELVRQLRVVSNGGGVGDLVRLFDGVRHDRPLGLLAIPGAVAPQSLGQLLEVLQGAAEAHVVAVAVLVSLRIAAQGSGFGWYPTGYLLRLLLQIVFLLSS